MLLLLSKHTIPKLFFSSWSMVIIFRMSSIFCPKSSGNLNIGVASTAVGTGGGGTGSVSTGASDLSSFLFSSS